MLDSENMAIVVDTIFRKAQNEKEYIILYGDLCERLTRFELCFKGNKKMTRNALKESNFRTALLSSCQTSFSKFFVDPKQLPKDDEDAMWKYKMRLQNNIEFVGELNKRNLLSDVILISIYNSLLCID